MVSSDEKTGKYYNLQAAFCLHWIGIREHIFLPFGSRDNYQNEQQQKIRRDSFQSRSMACKDCLWVLCTKCFKVLMINGRKTVINNYLSSSHTHTTSVVFFPQHYLCLVKHVQASNKIL